MPLRHGETKRSRGTPNVTDVETYLLRLWLPDRPGALGQVASRIGAVRGDVVAIDILERDGGQAIDELVVELPGADLVGLLVDEVRQVDGVRVEEVRPTDRCYDPRLDALESVARLVAADDLVELYDGVVACARQVAKADWAALVDTTPGCQELPARTDDAPSGAWLRAFVAGSETSRAAETAGVAWAPLPSSGLALIVGRDLPFRGRENRYLAALARVAGSRRRELSEARARAEHPSVVR